MAIFNDLAIELQEAIWEMVLPASRGVHWIEVEGIPHSPEHVRESICMTQLCMFDCMPETYSDVFTARRLNPAFHNRAITTQKESSPFFRYLLTTVPAVFGRGSEPDYGEEFECDLADEIAYTSRCRQLSTYYQITTLLSLCRLSRFIAQRYIRNNHKCSWPIRRSMGKLYRPRPMDVWEAQYSGNKNPPASLKHNSWQLLRPRIHMLDLVIFRLHDSEGRATSLLRHAPWQYWIEQAEHKATFACFSRVGFEWHPSWGTVGGRGELRHKNISAFIRQMQNTHFFTTPYWLVDGVPRPDWKRDYPAVVRDIFAGRMANDKVGALEHLKEHWQLEPEGYSALLADHHLGQQFEANGRRYYIVFVVASHFYREQKDELYKLGLGWSGPFPGNAAMWPEVLREPVRLAYDVCRKSTNNLGTYNRHSLILSWESIG